MWWWVCLNPPAAEPVCQPATIPLCHSTHSSTAEDLAAQRIWRSAYRFRGGVNSQLRRAPHCQLVDTLLQQSGDGWKMRRKRGTSKSDLLNPVSFWVRGGFGVHVGGGWTEVGGWCGNVSPLLHLGSPPSCHLLCVFWWSAPVRAKCAGMDRGWTDAAGRQGACETANRSSPPGSPSCRAVGWAIAGEHSFHMWVFGSDADLSQGLEERMCVSRGRLRGADGANSRQHV